MAPSHLKYNVIRTLRSLLLLLPLLVYGEHTSSVCSPTEKIYDYVLITDDINLHEEHAISEDVILANKLKEYGLNVVRKSFMDPKFDWSLAKSVILRTAWARINWKQQWSDFMQSLRSKTNLVNSFELYDEHTNKWKYLQRLIRKGINVPTTEYIEMGSKGITLEQIQKEHGWESMVFKPNTGQVGYAVFKVTNDNMEEMESTFQTLVRAGHVLVQEFQRTFLIDKSSRSYSREVSAIYFDGKFSHAIGKTPALGDFKVHGGFNWNHTATKEEIEFGQKVVSAFQEDYPVISYMRVDMFRDNSNELALMEIAATVADMFFRTNSSAVDGLAKHLLELSQSYDTTCDTDQAAGSDIKNIV